MNSLEIIKEEFIELFQENEFKDSIEMENNLSWFLIGHGYDNISDNQYLKLSKELRIYYFGIKDEKF